MYGVGVIELRSGSASRWILLSTRLRLDRSNPIVQIAVGRCAQIVHVIVQSIKNIAAAWHYSNIQLMVSKFNHLHLIRTTLLSKMGQGFQPRHVHDPLAEPRISV